MRNLGLRQVVDWRVSLIPGVFYYRQLLLTTVSAAEVIVVGRATFTVLLGRGRLINE